MRRHIGLLIALALLLPIVGLATQTKAAATTTKKASTRLTLRAQASGTTAGVPSGIDYTWTPGDNAAPPCSATTTTNCILGQQLTIVLPGGGEVIIQAGTGTGQIGPTDAAYAWAPGGQIAYGTYQSSLVTAAYDNSGALIFSTAATATTVNALTTLNPPTGLAGVVK
jgi:hypothetical protein